MAGDAAAPQQWWDGKPFERILIDAPCSATGVIRRHPDIKVLRRPADVERAMALQARLLRALGAEVQPFLADQPTLYGVLARTREFRAQAAAFLDAHPRALGVSLGCGLAHYFQWLDRGRNRWIDADLPEVIALRETLLPGQPRRRNHGVDLGRPGWWDRLGLPGRDGHRTPVLLICEGLLMYLEPAQVQAQRPAAASG